MKTEEVKMKTLAYYWYIVPIMFKHLRGNWFVFRDAPDWVVEQAMNREGATDKDLISLSAEARKEYESRKNKK